MKPYNRLVLLSILLVTIQAMPLSAGAQTATGNIQGRVLNSTNGQYLENARLRVEGTNITAFTDAEGNYRLMRVPASTVNIVVFYTGLSSLTEPHKVEEGKTTQHDFTLGGDLVLLEEFKVETTREMSGAAIAINEQRFAPNFKTVISTDEYGTVTDGNAGEFLKFVPGVQVDSVTQGGNARFISINGVPPNYVPVKVAGFDLASAGAPNQTNRVIEIDMVPLNNISRIEIEFSPTPESSGSALAGSVNMVPRSSFEHTRKRIDFSTFIMMRDNHRDFGETPGANGDIKTVFPGFDASAIVPISDDFGFTLSASTSTQFTDGAEIRNTWRGASAGTSGAFVATTPDRPYLSAFNIIARDSTNDRRSVSGTLDYKIPNGGRLALALLYSHNEFTNLARNILFDTGGVSSGNYDTSYTHGNVGAGSYRQNIGGETRVNRTIMPTLTWRHDGPYWKATAGVGYSKGDTKDLHDSRVEGVNARRGRVTVNFDDISQLRPGSIATYDGLSGQPVDPWNLSSYRMQTADDNPRLAVNVRKNVYANVSRDFNWVVPVTLKVGLDVSSSMRDNPGSGNTGRTYVGPDGIASNFNTLDGFLLSDDIATPYIDTSWSKRNYLFGFPALQVDNPFTVYDALVANPSYFVTNRVSEYNSFTTSSKRSEEIITAAYLRGDLSFLNHRLKIVTGLRVEQTNVDAEGPQNDPTKNRQIVNGVSVPITTDQYEAAKLTLSRRGFHSEKEYLRLFPSINIGFNLRDNLIARASYYHSIGRPDFNQYSGGITLPDLTNPNPNQVITVNNVNIQPWDGRSAQLQLEYYMEPMGMITIGGFHREISKFFGSTRFPSTPEFLAAYGVDPILYGDFDVSTQHNVPGLVTMSGITVSYKQALTFLPHYARGIQIFANASDQRATGDDSANFSGFVPRTASWGVSLNRPKFGVRMNWNYRSESRQARVTGGSIEQSTFNWFGEQLELHVQGEYVIYKNIRLFANLRNITDEPQTFKSIGPSTPEVATVNRYIEYGSLWTFGIKATW